MKSIDKNYLLLQFKDRVHQKNAMEFQTFFEDVMSKSSKEFKKVSSGGGDGGNDGYISASGTYYQVYAPKTPAEKRMTASSKFETDFTTLKEKWSHIADIKEYNFVFNDKYAGTRRSLEEIAAKLKKKNPGIEFNVFLTENLEELFFELTTEQMKELGFDIDSRNALKAVGSYLEKLEIELDRNNATFVLKTLDNIKAIVDDQNDESLLFEYELLEARALQRLEKTPEAKKQFESLSLRYQKDPRAILYLAEIYLNDENFEKNEELIQQAEVIDATHWLLVLQKLIRNFRLGDDIDISKIDEKTFPKNQRIKSDYYRLHSIFLEKAGDTTRSGSFIERAIHFNPDKFSCYDVKLSHLEERFLLSESNQETRKKEGEELLKKIEEVENRLRGWNGLTPKHQSLLNVRKMHIFTVIENYPKFEKIAKETFDLILNCHFDYSVDRIICNLLQYIELPEKDLLTLFIYLDKVEKPISNTLAQMLFFQFMHKENLFTEGKKFFEKNGKKTFVEIIEALKAEEHDIVIKLIGDNLQFLVALHTSDKVSTELRKEIIKALPDDGTLKKEKLVFLDLYHEKDYDGAFEIVQTMDLKSLNYVECVPMVEVAREKKAWDVVIPLTEKMLEFETETQSILKLELDLLTANLNSERFIEVIRIGESILGDSKKMAFLDEENQEIMLSQTVYAWTKRGKYPEAKELMDKYSTLFRKFETKVSVQTEVYLKNLDPTSALNAVVEAVKIKERLSAEEYGSLFFVFTQIGNLMKYSLDSDNEIKEGSFVKIKGQERWLFVGDNDELDATKILKTNHSLYLGKKVGDKLVLETRYSSEKIEQEIELILPIGKYILWQSNYNAQELSKGGMWDAMKAIEVPSTPKGEIDPKFLIKALEDQNKRGKDFFEIYCEQNMPLALLAVSEGGLPKAIGKIQSEQRGFIKFSDGTQKEFDEQKKVAESIIAGQEFYIDGTSALVLSENGLLKKIQKYLPNIKSPQSVISLLLELSENFTSSPGQVGHMSYSKGKINFTNIDKDKYEEIKQNFLDTIDILEAKKESVEVISLANKSGKFSEQEVPSCLSDATILAQKNSIPVVTEDFLYLQMNEIETSKPKPKYCSSLAIIRVLYEQGKISFNEYLDFYGYLSSYRFRFLLITVEDIEKAIFGEESSKVTNIENLKKLNIGLTLSEEYGVLPKTSQQIILTIIINMMVDDTVSVEDTEKIFDEIINTFPTKQDKQLLGRALIVTSAQIISKGTHSLTVGANVQAKIDILTKYIQMYDASKNNFKP